MHKRAGKNFAPQKQRKREKRTRKSPKKANPGAFWVLEGVGTVENGSNQMRKPGVRTQMNPIPMQHRQKENRRKPSVFSGFVAGAEGLVSPAGSSAAPRWGAPSTDRGGSRDRRSRVPLALALPSARGFGVDVGIRQREPWRTGFKLSFSQNHKRAVLVWCSQDGARRVPKPRLI